MARFIAAAVGFAAWRLLTSSAVAAEPEEPAPDFLEYLGSWQEGDEEWVIVADIDRRETAEQAAEPEPEPKPKAQEDDEDDQ